MTANISNTIRKGIYRREGYRCALCDDTHGLQIHHIIPRSKGGSDDPANLICLCWRCHAEAHGTWLPERHGFTHHYADPHLRDTFEQLCTEYVCEYYATMHGIAADPVNGGGVL